MDQQQKISYLHEQIVLAEKMADVLNYSWQQIATMENILTADSKQWTSAQATEFEALSARFARLSDILIQKLFRAIDAIELIDEGSLLDRLARMEKRQIISDMEQWTNIRELRNQIAHDYVASDLAELHRTVFNYCPLLTDALAKLVQYSETQNWHTK
jgi:uncharacterized protein YutE (UPF0331/DUF86 family)